MSLDLLQTLAVAAFVFSGGVWLKRVVPVLTTLRLPAAVVGGLCGALGVFLLRSQQIDVSFDTSTQSLFMIAFFTSVGFGASIDVLKRGGSSLIWLLVLSTIVGLVQNVVGVSLATLLGEHPLLGVMAGSLTLMGGPATGMAFADAFSSAGVASADVVAVTAATVGIVFGGLTGGPIGAYLANKYGHVRGTSGTTSGLHMSTDEPLSILPGLESGDFTRTLLVLGVVIGIGSVVGMGFGLVGWTLPAYIGAMIVGSIVRNVLDRRSGSAINVRLIQFLGGVSLNIFLTVALLNVRLWELEHVAGPLAVILAVQVVVIVLLALMLGYRVFGRDYDATVVTAGFVGYMLGTTANAVANMQTLTDAGGPAPRALLIVPIVGAFFIDFTNALMINVCLHFFG